MENKIETARQQKTFNTIPFFVSQKKLPNLKKPNQIA